MLSTKYSVKEFWDNCMWMHGSFCCCIAIACHQCYFLQLTKHLRMLTWVVGTQSSSNSITALCPLPGVGMGGGGSYKVEINKHYFPNVLLIYQYLHLPLCGPLNDCFSHQSICSLTPRRNINSCETSHNTIYYSLVVKWTASIPNLFKVSGIHNGSCDVIPLNSSGPPLPS
jgi:hypothetical protein